MNLDMDSAFASSGPAAKFTTIGDQHIGRIVSLELRQSTDFETGEPKFWPNGDPVPELLVGLATADGDTVTLYARGAMFAAIRNAVKAAGAKKPDIGGELAIKYTGDDEPKKKGYKGAKQYQAAYDAPTSAALADAFADTSEPTGMPF